ncbi:S-layer homology domain-containing protein [Paenibacillus polymyxa]|uniref:S-layer homology domain-containing protein n=1 Tax=Paenibacillus TaxID=44249 RepID=UPI0008B11CB7|nr:MULTISPECIES: S-layer homology domain-containing protein [Paenibacillus]KAF6659400.1 S-layer homology domain-containing protein [Paenibacillus sp. EKM301P]MBE3646618.1 S-layer protein [Paenibacillus polymyxa]RPE01903.1 S-layer protein [Paenibacillus polymyxa]UBS85948.1 S-layer homology domain-containing protein [Paenibacillus polymyxa]WHX34473.1 S-layer homology domain-containing protein [Paenibacillus polymyxa]
MRKIKSFCLSYLAIIVLFGTWTWSFSESAVYATSSPVPSVTDAVYATETTVTSWTNPSKQGQSVTFSIKTISTPQITKDLTGTVVLMDGTDILDTLTMRPNGIANGYATATYTTSNLSVGSHPITALYSGDARFIPSTSEPYIQVVNASAPAPTPSLRPTVTTVLSSTNPSSQGQEVRFSVRTTSNPQTSGDLTGTVILMDGTNVLDTLTMEPVGISNGYANGYYTTRDLSVGSHAITAIYSGDARFAPSTSEAYIQVVNGNASTGGTGDTSNNDSSSSNKKDKKDNTDSSDSSSSSETTTPSSPSVSSTVLPTPEIMPVEQSEVAHEKYITGYQDGTFRPDQSITRAETAAMMARIMKLETKEGSTTYKDVPSTYWAKDSIIALTTQHLMNGYADGTFRPEQPITRAEMAAILASWKQLKGTQTTASPYTDIEKHWARDSIVALANAGWITGYNDGSFQPNKYITRVETVTILNTILKRGPLEGTIQATWKDVPTDYWAFKNIEEASRTHTSTIDTDGIETFVK